MTPRDDDPSLDLERALQLDALAEEYRVGLEGGHGVTPEAFAAQHPEVEAELVAVLRGIALLAGPIRRPGPLGSGDRVGPYVIRGELGRGGMGVVYEAVEEELGRVVALKAFDASATDPKFRIRFQREARAAARLDHSGIVPVFGTGESGTTLWYAMRRVEGVALDTVLGALSGDAGEETRREVEGQMLAVSSSTISGAARSGTGRQRAAATIAMRIAEALAYAHAEGVLHRDVKPGNVMLDRDGTPQITDFGLCKIEGDASLTADTDIVGTLRYLPPEALHGRADARGDVYGVGLVLYELLAGVPAFVADDRNSLLQRILNEDPTPLRKLVPDLPEDLERVVNKATAKLVEERYATAADLAEDLGAFLAGQPVRARPPSALYLARLFARRNRALVALASLMVLLLGTLVTVHVIRLGDVVTQLRVANGLAKTREAEALTSGAEATLQAGEVAGAKRLLEQVPADERGGLWQHLAARVGLDAVIVPSPMFSTDGVASYPGRERYYVWSYEIVQAFGAGSLDLRSQWRFNASSVAMTGRGHEVVAVSRRSKDLWVWSGTAGEPGRVLAPLESSATRVTVAEDSGVAVVLTGSNEVIGVDIETGDRLYAKSLRGYDITSLASLGAGAVAWGLGNGVVARWDVEADQVEVAARMDGGASALLAHGGELHAAGSSSGELVLLAGLTGVADFRLRLEGPVIDIQRVPGRDELAVLLETQTVAIVDHRTGTVVRSIPGATTNQVGMHLGTEPWMTVIQAGFRDVEHGPDAHDGRIGLPGSAGPAYGVAVSPRADRIVTSSGSGFLHVYGFDGGEVRSILTGEKPHLAPTFSPSGAYVAAAGLVVDADSGDVVLDWSPPAAASVTSTWLASDVLILGARIPGSDPSSRESAVELYRWSPGDTEPVLCAGPSESAARYRSLRLIPHASKPWVYALTWNCAVECWDTLTGDMVWSDNVGGQNQVDGVHDVATDALVLACRDGMVHVVDAATGEARPGKSWQAGAEFSRLRTLNSLSLSPDGSEVVTCTSDGRIELWGRADGRRIGGFSSRASAYRHARYVGDTGWIVATGQNGEVTLFGAGESPWSPVQGRRGGSTPGTDGHARARSRGARPGRVPRGWNGLEAPAGPPAARDGAANGVVLAGAVPARGGGAGDGGPTGERLGEAPRVGPVERCPRTRLAWAGPRGPWAPRGGRGVPRRGLLASGGEPVRRLARGGAPCGKAAAGPLSPWKEARRAGARRASSQSVSTKWLSRSSGASTGGGASRGRAKRG